jgi:hypothetical protein
MHAAIEAIVPPMADLFIRACLPKRNFDTRSNPTQAIQDPVPFTAGLEITAGADWRIPAT